MEENICDYSQTIIYKLCCKDPLITDIYIGHTKNFKQRRNTHKTSCCNENDKKYNQYVYKFIRETGGWENWRMLQIEERNCKDKREAESVEQYWIEKLGASLNTNKPYAMCKEDEKTYKKIWYEEKKDYILEKAKQNYKENKDKKLEYQKQYAEENKDHIAEKQKEYRVKNKEKLAEQKKIYREEHKEEAKEKQKAWREQNKEKLKEKRSEILICDCGNQFIFGNKNRHLQSKNHIEYQNKLCGVIIESEKEYIEQNK
jgi:tRNA G10  N-methylase Trm11